MTAIIKYRLRLLNLYKILVLTNRPDYEQRPDLQQKVEEYSKQIDQLVYKLYGLTEDEIKRVEEKIK